MDFNPDEHEKHLDAFVYMATRVRDEEDALATFKEIVAEAPKVNFNFFSKKYNTPLCVAVCNNMKKVVSFLRQHGADVNFPGDVKTYPIHYAAALGDIEMFAQLMNYGADAKAQDENGNTALITAISKKNFALAGFMLDTYLGRIDLEQCIIEGYTALHHAVFAENVELVRKLLALGANVNCQPVDGLTPLGVIIRNLSKRGQLSRQPNSLLFVNPENESAAIQIVKMLQKAEETASKISIPKLRPVA